MTIPKKEGTVFLNIPLFRDIPKLELYQLINELPIENYKDGDSIFSKYPAFNEVRELFDGLPLLSQEQSETFAALHEAFDAHFMGLLMTHREAIFEGLFGGGDGPNWSNDDPQEKRLN